MERTKFYSLSISIAIAIVLVAISILTSGKDLGLGAPVFIIVFIVLPVFIALIIAIFVYEIRHPIQDLKTYKKINIISVLIILAALLNLIFYFIPIINNYEYFNKLMVVGYKYHIPTLKELLLYPFALWRYLLIVLSSITLLLSFKKINLARLTFFLSLVLVFILQITELGFWGKGLNSAIYHSESQVNELISIYNNENAILENDASLCFSNPTNEISKARCIRDIAYKQNNPTLCSDIEFRIKAECLSHFALINKNPNLCLDLIGDNIDVRFLRNCIDPIAKNLKDPTICELYYKQNDKYTDNIVKLCKNMAK